MKKSFLFLFIIVIYLVSCKTNSNEFIVKIASNASDFDTLFIQNEITGSTIGKIPLKDLNKGYKFSVNEPTIGTLKLNGSESTFLTIFEPQVKKIIYIDSLSVKTKNSYADSLLIFLGISTNEMFKKHSEEIFGQNDSNLVLGLFDSLMIERSKILKGYESELGEIAFKMLEFQNKARVYSFLMYYGRNLKNLPPEDKFFDFIDDINNESSYNKTLPQNVLYKYEIQFLRKNDTLTDVQTFLTFIEDQTMGICKIF